MFRSALIAVGGTGSGHDQALLAQRLGDASTRLTLAGVYPTHTPAGPSGSRPGDDAEQGIVDAALQRASYATSVGDTRSVAARSVGEGLTRIADMDHADLLVLGSHAELVGTIGFADWLARTLTHVSCPIAVAPAGYGYGRDRPILNVGVVYDDSRESDRALVLAKRFARERRAKLSGFHTPTTVNRDSPKAGIHIAADLRDFAANVDLLVICPRGAGPLDRLTHPSATLSLLDGIESPLLLVTQHVRLPVGGAQVTASSQQPEEQRSQQRGSWR